MSAPIRDSFGARVRDARKASGMHQGELAAAIGCHQTTIARIERGRQDVSIGQAAAISTVLDTPLGVLLGDRPIWIPVREVSVDVEVRIRRVIADAEQLVADLRGLLP